MSSLREQIHEIIFEADTPAGKAFDVALLWVIILSVVAVSLESVNRIAAEHGTLLTVTEWLFTILFTVEYLLRLLSVKKPIRYALSFYGLVDLLAVLPTYASLFYDGAQYLMVIRILRLLRVFRVLKLARYVGEGTQLINALQASLPKITVFIGVVLAVSTIVGAMMYIIEGEAHGFTSIPRSIYWAIITLTTVGYGDIAPETALGQSLAAMVMIMGYGIIAVPTGIVSAEFVRQPAIVSTRACDECSAEGHDHDADYCKYCGAKM